MTTNGAAPHGLDDALVIPVTGMTCTACANRVQRALAKAPGVLMAEVSFTTRSARVTLEDPQRDLAGTLEAIAAAGYEPAANVEQILARRGAAEAAKAEGARLTRDANRALLALAREPEHRLLLNDTFGLDEFGLWVSEGYDALRRLAEDASKRGLLEADADPEEDDDDADPEEEAPHDEALEETNERDVPDSRGPVSGKP